MNPELSVAVGGVHVTVVDVVPRSAVLMIFDGQFEKVGSEMSLQEGFPSGTQFLF